MGLFGSKATLSSGASVSPQGELNIQKIPDVFYGGKNPVIYEQRTLEKGVSASADILKAPFRSSGASKSAPVSVPFRKSKMFWIVFGIGIVVVGVASTYYVMQYRSTAPRPSPNNTTNTIPTNSATEITSSLVTSNLVATSTLTSTSSTPPSLTSNFLEFPPINLGSTADIDLDQLTDIEEELYTIDSGTWDTDQDGYYDGQEILNLYNPRGFAPVKLIDSGIILEYINPYSEYRVYYPMQWQRGSVDTEDRHVLFSTIAGEFVEIRVFEKTPGTTFASWFQVNAPEEQFNLLSGFTNRFGVEGWRRSDGQVIYFDTTQFVFVLAYHQPDSRAPIPYRSTVEMMYQSFRPTATTRTIPDQVPLEIPTDVPASPTAETSSTLPTGF